MNDIFFIALIIIIKWNFKESKIESYKSDEFSIIEIINKYSKWLIEYSSSSPIIWSKGILILSDEDFFECEWYKGIRQGKGVWKGSKCESMMEDSKRTGKKGAH